MPARASTSGFAAPYYFSISITGGLHSAETCFHVVYIQHAVHKRLFSLPIQHSYNKLRITVRKIINSEGFRYNRKINDCVFKFIKLFIPVLIFFIFLSPEYFPLRKPFSQKHSLYAV